MTRRMLIDARHQEEIRVAVLKGNRIEEFDFESSDHKQIKGNIYLAKVTRVEPSLQAAFIDFGGNRHGFLAFSEIHPDYYQIPKEDREALLAEEAAHAEEEAALRAAHELEDDNDGAEGNGVDSDDSGSGNGTGDALADELAGDDGPVEVHTSTRDDVATIEGGEVSDPDDNGAGHDNGADDEGDGDESNGRPRRGRRGDRAQSREADELRAKRMALRRRYKIQDVIHRRQVLLVQVVKEERGNKGAALTTYLSLAGRYCVLMPNSSHGGGISRKINSAADRKRLKSIVAELKLPKSMGCIVRTAGLSRTKTEIKRDFDYLARLWDEIRERTLKSSAPALIHSDSDLIKRAIRDIYNREIEEVIVEGEAGYRSAKEFMKLLMPSHARRVRQYVDPVPLFQRYGAEDQLTAMYDPVVQLKSGGYLVINPTEALVSIDINSGRSTREHGIEQTALSTNLEAAREIARQLRLRDMAGLVVIDFIDMEHNSNVRKVEKAMKDALKDDRARIQVGRISGFGLMEMSRQRLRTGVLEATTRTCPHCDGSGLVRTAGSAGLSALRLIEDEAAKGKGTIITLFASQEAAIYVLNAKRADLAEIEDRYGVAVEVVPEGENEGAKMRVASSGPRPLTPPRFEPVVPEEDEAEFAEEFAAEDEDGDEEEREAGPDEREAGREDEREGGRGRRKRRRGRKTSRDEPGETELESSEHGEPSEEAEEDQHSPEEPAAGGEEPEGEGGQRRRRRRSRRRRGDRERTSDQPISGDEAYEGSSGDESFGEDGESDETNDADLVVAREAVAVEGAETPADADVGASPEVAPDTPADVRPEAGGDRQVEAEPESLTTARAEVEPEAVTAQMNAPLVEPAPVSEAKPRAPRRRRRTKAEIAADAEAASAIAEQAANEAASELAGEEAPATLATPVSEAEPEGEAEPPTQANPASEEAPAEQKEPARFEDVAELAPIQQDEIPPVEPAAGEELSSAPADEPQGSPTADPEFEPASGSEPPRRGWWQRTFGA